MTEIAPEYHAGKPRRVLRIGREAEVDFLTMCRDRCVDIARSLGLGGGGAGATTSSEVWQMAIAAYYFDEAIKELMK